MVKKKVWVVVHAGESYTSEYQSQNTKMSYFQYLALFYNRFHYSAAIIMSNTMVLMSRCYDNVLVFIWDLRC